MFAFAAMGVLITSASAILYGEPIWDPVRLVGRFQNPWIVGFAMFVLFLVVSKIVNAKKAPEPPPEHPPRDGL